MRCYGDRPFSLGGCGVSAPADYEMKLGDVMSAQIDLDAGRVTFTIYRGLDQMDADQADFSRSIDYKPTERPVYVGIVHWNNGTPTPTPTPYPSVRLI